MENNCLIYLLDLWRRGHRFEIFYNSHHCIGMDSYNLFDFNNQLKDEIREGSVLLKNYLLIEKCHDKETVGKIFNLSKEQFEILTKYYARN